MKFRAFSPEIRVRSLARFLVSVGLVVSKGNPGLKRIGETNVLKIQFSCLGIVLLLGVILGSLLFSMDAAAQQVYTYANRAPTIRCSNAVYGSKITVSIREAPPESIVWFTMSLLEGDSLENGSYSIPDAREPDLSAINSWHEAAVVDRQGRAFFDIPLGDGPDWLEKKVLFKAFIKDNSIEDNSHLMHVVFTVNNPELCIATAVPVSGTGRVEGRINKIDELAGKLIAEITNVGGTPEKIVFTRDFQLGFAMLDQDRIAIFDNVTNHLIWTEQTGIGLVDIVVTPDGSKLVALTRGVKSSNPYAHNPYSSGELWIFDVETLRDPNQFSNTKRHTIYPINVADEGVGNLMAVSEDSTMLAIRHGEMDMSCYDLISDQYIPFHLGDNRHFRSEIRDIKLIGNRLLALVVMPDGSSELMFVNLQNFDLLRSISVGSNVERIVLYHPEDSQPGVVLLDAADETCDFLIVIDILSNEEPLMIRVPDGVVDFDVTETCGICMFLLQQSDPLGRGSMEGRGNWEGEVRFIDLQDFSLLPDSIPLDLSGDGRVYLSRAQCSSLGYVYTEQGSVTQIDLETFEIIHQVRVSGTCTGSVAEVY